MASVPSSQFEPVPFGGLTAQLSLELTIFRNYVP